MIRRLGGRYDGSGEGLRNASWRDPGGCCGQDIKGVRGMTRHLKAMKDVETCDKPRGGGNNRYYPGISEWGNLAGLNTGRPQLNA